MPVAKLGRGSFILIGEESTWGSSVATPVSNRIMSETLLRKQERSQKTHLSTSASVFAFDSFDAMEICEGSITTNILYHSTGQLMKAACGSLSTTAHPSVAGSFAHKYKPADELPSLTIDLQKGNSGSEKFLGMMVSSFNLSIEAGGLMESTFNFIGKTAEARDGDISSSFSAGNVNIRHFDAGTLSFGGNTYDLRSLNFNVDNKIERRDMLGSKLTAQPSTTDIRTCELEVTLDLENNGVLYAAQLAGTQSDAIITFAQGAPEQSMELVLFNCQIIEYDDSISSVGRIEVTMKLQAFADLNTSPDDAYQITIVNQEASGTTN